jgi:hypothetical protein
VFLLCAIAAVVTGAVLAAARFWVCDDAFISFRYADNLVRGHGLVFNLGERVEGFTNLAWTLWAALGLGSASRRRPGYRRLYFDRTPDPAREQPFRVRLGP